MVSLPGVASLLISVVSLGLLLISYFGSGYVSLPLAILCMGSLILGSLFVLGALVLYALKTKPIQI